MNPETQHNPFQAPRNLDQHPDAEAAAVLQPHRRFPTPLFRWVMGIILFEIILSLFSLTNKLGPTYLTNPLTPVGSFGLNVLVLAFVSWQIARRFKVAPALLLSQLIHTVAWLVFVLVACQITVGGISQPDWEWALTWVACSALINGLITTAASTWFRVPAEHSRK